MHRRVIKQIRSFGNIPIIPYVLAGTDAELY